MLLQDMHNFMIVSIISSIVFHMKNMRESLPFSVLFYIFTLNMWALGHNPSFTTKDISVGHSVKICCNYSGTLISIRRSYQQFCLWLLFQGYGGKLDFKNQIISLIIFEVVKFQIDPAHRKLWEANHN